MGGILPKLLRGNLRSPKNSTKYKFKENHVKAIIVKVLKTIRARGKKQITLEATLNFFLNLFIYFRE